MIATLAIVLSANCVSAQDLTPEQKACCAAMKHDCERMAGQMDCCATAKPTQLQQASAVKAIVFAAPVRILAAILVLPEPLDAGESHVVDSLKNTTQRPPGRSTYVLNSTFRI